MAKLLQTKEGYTIIEVLVVIVILGLFMIVGFANYREFSRKQDIISTVRLIAGDLKLAQTESMSGKKPTGCMGVLQGYEFRFATITGNVQSYNVQATCLQGANRTSVLVKEVTLPTHLTVTYPSINPIIFRPLTLGTNLQAGSSTTILIRSTDPGFTQYQRTITATSTGEIR